MVEPAGPGSPAPEMTSPASLGLTGDAEEWGSRQRKNGAMVSLWR